jgi:AcrR family transcriptional regulator
VTRQQAPERPLRRDAQRNRESIVAAALAAFAASGVDVSVEEIARRAGVGMGTLYRRFPTKEDLVDAVLEETFDEFVAIAEAAVAKADAWQGFCEFLERSLALHTQNRALKDLVATQEHGRARAAAMRRRLRPLLAQLVQRAQEQGMLRPDFEPQDVALVFWSAGGVIERGGAAAAELWRRYLGLLLDGLRVSAATPLPQPPLTAKQLREIVGGGVR